MPCPMRFGPPPRIMIFFLPVAPLVLVAVGRVVIRREGLELGGAGVHEPVGGDDARGFARGAHFLVSRFRICAAADGRKTRVFSRAAERFRRSFPALTPSVCGTVSGAGFPCPLAVCARGTRSARNHRSIFVSSKTSSTRPMTLESLRRERKSAPRSAR